MKIIIDLYPCQSTSRYRGIGRYTLDFVQEFAVQRPKDWIVILLANGFFEASALELKKKFAAVLPHENFVVYAHPLREHFPVEEEYQSSYKLVMQRLIDEWQPDIYFSMGPIEGFQEEYDYFLPRGKTSYKKYCILYDFIPLIYSDKYLDHLPYKDFYLRRIEELRNFDHFFCISDTTKKDGVKYLERSIGNFTTIYGAVSNSFAEQTEQTLSDNLPKLLDKGFILYGGNLDHRKNLQNMLVAFSQLPAKIRKKFPLVLTSIKINKEYLDNLLKEYQLKASELIYLGHVDDAELVQLYRKCTLFCMPSMYEGLGLPVLEAMECGAVVIAANNSSLQELVENEEMQFDANNPEELSQLILNILKNKQLQNRIRKYGQKRVAEFSWQITCQKVVEKIKEINIKSDGVKKVIPLKQLIKSQNLSDITVRSLVWNEIGMEDSRFLIDITQICKIDARTGIQRVVKNVVQQLEAISERQVVPVYLEGNQLKIATLSADFVPTKTGQSIEFYPQDILFLIDSSWEYVTQFNPIAQRLRRMGGKVVTMVYDLIPIRFPQYCDQGLIGVFKNWLRESIEYSDAFIAISRYTADELARYIQEIDMSKLQSIYYAHLGSDPKEEKYFSRQKLNYLRGDIPTFLCVGTIEPRKGHELVLAAFERLWEKGLEMQLLFLGKLGWKMDDFATRIRSLAKTKPLIWLDKADDFVLQECYRNSAALIMASEVEGFGLPIIEAARYKLPVLASDIPVFREIGLDGAYYFERTSEDLQKQIQYFISQDKNEVLRKNVRIPLLSWKESGKLINQQLLGTIPPYQIMTLKN